VQHGAGGSFTKAKTFQNQVQFPTSAVCPQTKQYNIMKGLRITFRSLVDEYSLQRSVYRTIASVRYYPPTFTLWGRTCEAVDVSLQIWATITDVTLLPEPMFRHFATVMFRTTLPLFGNCVYKYTSSRIKSDGLLRWVFFRQYCTHSRATLSHSLVFYLDLVLKY
jgi:hypothetical protein